MRSSAGARSRAIQPLPRPAPRSLTNYGPAVQPNEPATPEPLTGWPPDPARLRAWRRRLGAYYLLKLGLILGVLGAPFLIAHAFRQGFDPLLAWTNLWPVALPAAAVGAFLLFVFPRMIQHDATQGLKRARRLAAELLEEGEELRLVMFAAWLGPRGYWPGFLVGSDRRLLRLHLAPAPQGCEVASLAQPLELERSSRRSNRNPLFRMILSAMESDQGLWIHGLTGPSYLSTDRFLLEPLVEWLEARGHEVGYRNDEDAELRERPAVPTMREVAEPKPETRRRGWILLALALLAILVALVLLA